MLQGPVIRGEQMLFDAVRRKLAAHPRRRPANPAISSGQRAAPLTQYPGLTPVA